MRSRKSKDTLWNDQKERGQKTMIYKTTRRKQTTQQHEPPKKANMKSGGAPMFVVISDN